VIKLLQRIAMMELLGWAPEHNSNYVDILTLDDVSKSSQDEFLKDTDSGLEQTMSHRPRACTALAATQTQGSGTKTNSDLKTLPQEYHGYRTLFK
jgi:hypothetical protein